MKNRIALIIVLVIIGHETIASPAIGSDTIPFKLTSHNNIAIQAILNEVDTVSLMFHTAANDLSLTQEAVNELTKIEWNSEEDVTSWGGEGTSRYSKSNSLKINKYQWDKIALWESRHSGPGTDGKFGPNLFEDKFIEIEFDSSFLIIHEDLPMKVEDYEKLALKFEITF